MVLWLSHWNHIQDLVDASTAIQLCAVNLANCLYSPQPAYLYLVPDYLGTGTHLLFIYTLFIFVLYIYILYIIYLYLYYIYIHYMYIFTCVINIYLLQNLKHFYLPNPSHQFNFSLCNLCTVS